MKKVFVFISIFVLSIFTFFMINNVNADAATDLKATITDVSSTVVKVKVENKSSTKRYMLGWTYQHGSFYVETSNGTYSTYTDFTLTQRRIDTSSTTTVTINFTTPISGYNNIKKAYFDHVIEVDSDWKPVNNSIEGVNFYVVGSASSTTTPSTTNNSTTPSTSSKSTTSTRTTTTTSTTTVVTNVDNVIKGGFDAKIVTVSNVYIKFELSNETPYELIFNENYTKIKLDFDGSSHIYKIPETFTLGNSTKSKKKYFYVDIDPLPSKSTRVTGSFIDVRVQETSTNMDLSIRSDEVSIDEYNAFFSFVIKHQILIGISLGVLLLLLFIIIIRRRKKNKKAKASNNYDSLFNGNNTYSNNSGYSSNYDYDDSSNQSSGSYNQSYNTSSQSYNNSSYHSQPSIQASSTKYHATERKRKHTGSIVGGIFMVAVGFAAFFMAKYAKTQFPDFTPFYIVCYIIVTVCWVGGAYNLYRGIITRTVKLRGKPAVGVVSRLWYETTTQTNNGATSTSTTYYLEFNCYNEYGEAVAMVQTIGHGLYKKLTVGENIPILVYKGDAVFDNKKYKQAGGGKYSISQSDTYSLSRKIFISYRRDGGLAAAELLHAKLQQYHQPYMDSELGSGNYLPQLMRKIDDCDVFLLLLSKDALVKRSEDDVYFQEIKEALNRRKIVIPIILDSFDFPENNNLWNHLKNLQCVKMSQSMPGYADDTVNRINKMLR